MDCVIFMQIFFQLPSALWFKCSCKAAPALLYGVSTPGSSVSLLTQTGWGSSLPLWNPVLELGGDGAAGRRTSKCREKETREDERIWELRKGRWQRKMKDESLMQLVNFTSLQRRYCAFYKAFVFPLYQSADNILKKSQSQYLRRQLEGHPRNSY